MSPPTNPLEQGLTVRHPVRHLAIGAVLIAALFLSCFHVTNLDIGGHMTVGRQILKMRAIPDTDFFSYTAAGRPYPVHQWLGEVALFSVDYVTGVTGLVFLRMALVFAGATLLYRNARRQGSPVVVAAAITLLLLIAARPRFFVRPFLVTLVFLPLLQLWMGELRQGDRRRLWTVPVLMTVWGHVHSGVVFGVLLLGANVVAEGVKLLIVRIRSGDQSRWPGPALGGWAFRRFALVAAISSALPFATVALVNPSGVKPLLLPFLFFGNEGFRLMIAEYRAVDLSVDWPFNLVAGALVLGLLLRPRRIDLTDLFVVAGFGFLAFEAVRAILPFAAVAAPVLGRTWGSLGAAALVRAGGGKGKRRARVARANAVEAIAILLVVVAALYASVASARNWMFPFGIGKDPRHYPERALDFLDAQSVRGPIFNTDVWASSILWRWRATRYPVFVDARLEAYPEDFWRDKYYRVLQAAPGWQGVLDQYDVQCAILRRKGGETDDRIGEALWADPSWGLVYWDDYVLMFLRRGEQRRRNKAILENWEFDSIFPRRPQTVRDLRGEELFDAANQLAEVAEWSPASFLPWWTLAAAWTGLGQGEEAAEIFDRLSSRQDAKGNASFHRSWAEAELVAGRHDRWEALVREAGGDPGTAEELFDGAVLLVKAGLAEDARRMYEDVLVADPENTDAMNNLAVLLAQDVRGIALALELLEDAIRREPTDPYYVASRGEVYWRAGELARAHADFRRALEMLPPSDAAAREEIERWLSRFE